ncbi:MAG: HDIG domain-containing protein, partial [Thermoguttaceae bacterium]|nr:HDIG domain-containing protein [Thermoguttaceae bacterium]
TLAGAGQPLGEDEIRLLRLEHEATMRQRPLEAKLLRAGAVTALILALFALSAVYLYRCERPLLVHLGRLTTMLALIVLCIVLGTWSANDAWRAEVIPVLVFGQIVAIAYRQEVALVLSAVVALVLAAATGQGLSGFLLWMGVTATAVLHLGSIRTRSKLTYVGLSAGVAAILLTVGLAVLDGQPVNQSLLATAGCNGLWALAAALLLTVLLPFVERWFDVLTDLSLLELADVSHPLLQELVRRAPSTYNHSITVGSIAEAAAEAIGARGLLARVGAYYHDIGKMLKPGYFVENQARDGNRHESLAPAMSTLVIISHVKDGADLARQHGLPRPIIDFIEQHHGTTLVEYFYSRATEQCQQNPNGGEVDENLYRYPGPKPQTREAGVLMLADSVESASRALVDPAPSRIEGLVREVAERKLDDGQFDESGLTLRELRTIEDSMIKSLIANYHGRVKYPEPKSA